MSDELKKESGLTASKWLFLICWLVYACAYIARVNYSTAIDGMKLQGIIDENIAGLISGVYYGVYALGQIFNGVIADRRSPFSMVVLGLCIITTSNFAMAFICAPSWLLVLWWGINGLGQSMLWSPVFFIISNALNPRIRFAAVTVISLCTPVGKISGYFFSGISLSLGGWRGVFVMGGSIILLMLFLWVAFWLSLKKDIVIPQKAPNKKELASRNETCATSIGAKRLFIASGLLIAIPSLFIHGLFLNGASEWIPSILQSSYGLSDSYAAYLTVIIPAIGVFGVFLCNFVYRLFKENEMLTAAFFMIVSIIPVVVLYFLTASDGDLLGKNVKAVIFTAMYGVLYILQLGYSHCLISLIPMRFSVFTMAATFTGITNAINYFGSAASTYGMSIALANMRLDHIMILWLLLLSVASAFVMISIVPWKRFKKTYISENNPV